MFEIKKGCKDIGIRKFEFAAKTQFVCPSLVNVLFKNRQQKLHQQFTTIPFKLLSNQISIFLVKN